MTSQSAYLKVRANKFIATNKALSTNLNLLYNEETTTSKFCLDVGLHAAGLVARQNCYRYCN